MPTSNYPIGELCRIIGAEYLKEEKPEEIISEVLLDSRKLSSPIQIVFFALKTSHNNGHKYVDELYRKGVKNFVVSEIPEKIDEYHDSNVMMVNDTLKALQDFAKYHRLRFNIPVIGITGSNGKTIIKEWLYQLLSPSKNIVRSPKSYNSQTGVPLSVLQLNATHQMAIFEAGISEPDEMQRLEEIIQADIGLISNIGHAHDENFRDTEQKTSEKIKLFRNVKTLIYCIDHSDIAKALQNSGLDKAVGVFAWSRKKDCELRITKTEKKSASTEITAIYNKEQQHISIPFTDDASIENAIHCWAVLLLLDYSPEYIAAAMNEISPVAMRLEMKEGINNCSVINDSYNNDINSLSIALDFLKQQKQHSEHTLILSDILQSGKEDSVLYAEVAELIREKDVGHLIGIGSKISKHSYLFKTKKKNFYTSTADFLKYYPLADFHKRTILLKGARVFEFENINKVLQQMAHETVLEINLNALVSNLNFYRSLLNEGTRIMAMVKAFSYGSGSYEIANLLQFHNVDYLAVAYADEGAELRRAGISMPIMVMSPEEHSLDLMLNYNLEPEIYSMKILDYLLEQLRSGYHVQGTGFPVHIKIDTGMRRLGFSKESIDELCEKLKQSPEIRVKSVFSHLAASDKLIHDDFTLEQIKEFDTLSNRLIDELGYKVLRHILNSAGISRYPEAHFDMVRLGIGLYGVAGDERLKDKLQHIGRLRTNITQIHEIKAGQTAGYNRSFTAQNNTKTGIIPIGYADGLRRTLGNSKGRVYVKGQLRPIIGDICMDMTMIDISGTDAVEGDEVIIFGPEHPVGEMAEILNTIPYEILTSISRRVKRVYYYE